MYLNELIGIGLGSQVVRFSVLVCYFILNLCSCNSLFQLEAFFQKQRMKRKSNNVDSPKGYNPDNMDLLTLFIVNQISSKKEQTGTVMVHL